MKHNVALRLSVSLSSILAHCPDHGILLDLNKGLHTTTPRETSSRIAMLCEDDILLLIITKNISRFILFFGGVFSPSILSNASLRIKKKRKRLRYVENLFLLPANLREENKLCATRTGLLNPLEMCTAHAAWVFHACQPFFISQILRPYAFHASRWFEK